MITCTCNTTNSENGVKIDIPSLLSGLGVISPYAATIAAIDDNASDAIPRLTIAIEHDPKLTARMLGLANSTAFSTGRAIESIRQAVIRLGTELTKATCVAMVVSEGTRNKCTLLNRRGAWIHAMLVAAAAREIAKLSSLDILPGSAYSAGLLHDFGYLALSVKLSTQMGCLGRRLDANPNARSMELENSCLTVSHNAMGAAVGRQMGLPAAIVDAILFHHDPLAAPEWARPLATCIAVADQLTGAVEGAENPGFYPINGSIEPAWLGMLMLAQSALGPIVSNLKEDLPAIMSIAGTIA